MNARYWTAIVLASVFGTNLGDLYAHRSGLGIGAGLGVLVALASTAFLLERLDEGAHEVWYWLAIIIIRTGATNIADYLAFRLRVPSAALLGTLVLLLAASAWSATRRVAVERDTLPATGPWYWMAMLAAGVFGTVAGDVAAHALGQAWACIGLAAVLAAALGLWSVPRRVGGAALYWSVVAVARTAGTAFGDWFAESGTLSLGLDLATMLTGIAFVGVLVAWTPTPASRRV